MKRALPALLCLTLLLSLCLSGCGSDAAVAEVTPEVSAVPSPVPTAAETPEPTVSPEPTATPEPTAAPKPTEPPEPLEIGSYSCNEFVTGIPEGWDVSYEVFDAGAGHTRIVINITDPQDSNNRIFYTSALEPLFSSLDAKNAYLPHLDTNYEWSPVLDDISAEATLEQWPPLFTLMQAQGLGLDGYFKNYLLKDTIATLTNSASTARFTRSCVLGLVSIPDADSDYVMYFENSLVRQPIPVGLPYDATYYISYDNCAIVIREDLYEVQFPQLVGAMRSLNLWAFPGEHDITGSNGRINIDLPTDIPIEWRCINIPTSID